MPMSVVNENITNNDDVRLDADELEGVSGGKYAGIMCVKCSSYFKTKRTMFSQPNYVCPNCGTDNSKK